MIRKWLNEWHTRNCPACQYKRLEQLAWDQCVVRALASNEFAYYSPRAVREFVAGLNVPVQRRHDLAEIIYTRVGRSAHSLHDFRARLEYRLALYNDACSIYHDKVYGREE